MRKPSAGEGLFLASLTLAACSSDTPAEHQEAEPQPTHVEFTRPDGRIVELDLSCMGGTVIAVTSSEAPMRETASGGPSPSSCEDGVVSPDEAQIFIPDAATEIEVTLPADS